MLFRLLGPIEVCDEHTGLRAHPRSAAQRSLLAALLARPGVPVDSRTLGVEIWGDAAAQKAPNALQAHISRLRRTLMAVEPARRDPRLVGHGDGYVLWTDQARLDVEQFARSMAVARRLAPDDPVEAAAALRQALGHWRGSALEGCGRGPIAAGLAARLEQARAQAIRELAVVQSRSAGQASRPDLGSALRELADRLDGLAAEQRALRDTVHRLCALVSSPEAAAAARCG